MQITKPQNKDFGDTLILQTPKKSIFISRNMMWDTPSWDQLLHQYSSVVKQSKEKSVVIITGKLQIKLTSPERLWEEKRERESDGGILEFLGWTLWEEAPSSVSCSGITHTHTRRQTAKVPACCNYCLLRNGVSPCAVSLGLALGRVLLSILL